MRCLYCGKKLSLLKLAKGDSFCSSEHFDAHQLQLSKSAFDRLLSVSGNETERQPLVFTSTHPAREADTHPPVKEPAAEKPKSQPEVKALEGFQPGPEQRRVAEQSKVAPLKPKEAKAAHRTVVPQKSIAGKAAPKLIPAASEDAIARLKAFDGPPQAPFAFTQLPPFPPAPEAPLGVVAPATEAKSELAYPVHEVEVTGCILNLYLQLNQARFEAAKWSPQTRFVEPASEQFPREASLPPFELSPEFPKYEIAESEPAEESPLPLEAPATEAPLVIELAEAAFEVPLEPEAHEPLLTQLAPPVSSAPAITPMSGAKTLPDLFGPIAGTVPARPLIPQSPQPESPLPEPDRRVRFLVAPSFKERPDGEVRLDTGAGPQASLCTSGPELPGGPASDTSCEIATHGRFLRGAKLSPVGAKTVSVAGRDELPVSLEPCYPRVEAGASTIDGWHHSGESLRAKITSRNIEMPPAGPIGFLPAVPGFAVKPGVKPWGIGRILAGRGALARPVLSQTGPRSDAAIHAADPYSLRPVSPTAGKLDMPLVDKAKALQAAQSAPRSGKSVAGAFEPEPVLSASAALRAGCQPWQFLAAEGWNRVAQCTGVRGSEPRRALEMAPEASRQEPEQVDVPPRLSSAPVFEEIHSMRQGSRIERHRREAFVAAPPEIAFWPEAMSRLAALLPQRVPAPVSAVTIERCGQCARWEPASMPTPAPVVPRFLPARGGAVLPPVAAWRRLGAPPL
jgi:hypothetical protein